jgi:N-acetylglutamate synthase-like GNAT family acetyltransferase
VSFEISTDRSRLDLDLIHRFLSEESYWARGRQRAATEQAIAGSLCFGAYDDDGEQIGFARVAGDGATFGFLADVFVVAGVRGAGVGKALLEAVVSHPQVRDLARLTLVTDDAFDFYARYGFTKLDDAERWMIRRSGYAAQ